MSNLRWSIQQRYELDSPLYLHEDDAYGLMMKLKILQGVCDYMRSAEDTGIFKIDRYFVYFLCLTYLAIFKTIFWILYPLKKKLPLQHPFYESLYSGPHTKNCRMIGHCNKTIWNNGLKLHKALLLYICSSHAERQPVDILLKNGHILLCTSTQ